MQTQWFQCWANVPMLGRQWVGWLSTTYFHAAALDLALKGCAGAGHEILDAQGQPLQTSNIPGLPNITDYIPPGWG